MKYKIKLYFLSNKIILQILNYFLRLKNKKKYFFETEKRSRLCILDSYEEISKNLPYYPFDLIPDNNLYGISTVIKNYLNYNPKKNLNIHFEHGIYFGSYISKTTIYSYAKKIITISDNRVSILKNKTNKTCHSIGPYILYAKSHIDNKKLQEYKNKLGKVLLVFPSHSIDNLSANYNYDFFIKKIESIKSCYDSVLVCLYYVDVKNKYLVNLYKSYGYKIVCAGHKYDYNFLSRLKSIILLSDFTISNNIGTHTSYCIAMGKEHRIYNQIVIYEGSNFNEKNLRNNEELNTYFIEKSEIEKVLTLPSNIQECKNNISLLENYFGITSFIKSREELLKIIID